MKWVGRYFPFVWSTHIVFLSWSILSSRLGKGNTFIILYYYLLLLWLVGVPCLTKEATHQPAPCLPGYVAITLLFLSSFPLPSNAGPDKGAKWRVSESYGWTIRHRWEAQLGEGKVGNGVTQGIGNYALFIPYHSILSLIPYVSLTNPQFTLHPHLVPKDRM